MNIPWAFDEANRNSRKECANRLKQRANQINQKITKFFKEVDKECIDQKEKDSIKKLVTRGLTQQTKE